MDVRPEKIIMLHWAPNTEPLLSITCPTYNHEAFIADALDSFLAQRTSFAFEIVVNDDASTDGTAAIIADYAKRYPTIIKPIYQQENQFQKGKFYSPELFKRAQGKYIAFCDGDDYWTDPHKLQTQVNFLESNPDYVLTYHDALAFDENGPRGIQLLGKWRCDASSQDLLKARPLSTLTTCFRNVLHELPIELQQSPVVDICWWSLLGAYGKGKFLGDIAPAAYRMHAGGLFSLRSNKKKLHMTLQTYANLANYYNRLGNQALYEHFLMQVFGMALSAISPWRKLQALMQVARNVSVNLGKRLLLQDSRG